MIHILMRLLLLMKLKPMMTIPSRCRSKVAKFGISSFGYFELHRGLASPSISIMVGEGVGIGGHYWQAAFETGNW